MPIIPLLAVTVLLDGRPVLAYAPAIVIAGRTYAPLLPYATSVAQSISFEDNLLVLQRATRQVRIRMRPVEPDALAFAYVPIARILRGLGATVSYDAREHTVDVHLPHAVVVRTPAPFNPSAAQVGPLTVFTPPPMRQPMPPWHGPALPRRTPLPYPVPT